MVVYKYDLPVNGGTVRIRGNFSAILYLAAQDGHPKLWMECDEENYKEQDLMITAIGTGWEMEDTDCDYYGSCIDGLGYVWHYYGDPFIPQPRNEENELSGDQLLAMLFESIKDKKSYLS